MRVSNAATDAGIANFTFDDLKKIADGKYNKGEVLLSKDGKLVTVNNHVTLTDWNDIVSSSEQNRAVRKAIAKALEKDALLNGVRGSSRVANEIKNFLLEESNKNLPLSRDELRKLVQIYSAKGRQGDGNEISKQIQKELDVIREFGRAKMSANADELNAFVGTLKGKLGDSAAQLGTDIQSWVKGLTVANLDAKTRATVLKPSNNQSREKTAEALRSYDVLGTTRNITPSQYERWKPYAEALTPVYIQEAEKILFPELRVGKAPSSESIQRFLQSIYQKGDELHDKMYGNKKIRDLDNFSSVAQQEALVGMFAKSALLSKAFIANDAFAARCAANFNKALDSLGAAAQIIGEEESQNQASLLVGFAQIQLQNFQVARGAYIFSMSKEAAVEEMWRLTDPEYQTTDTHVRIADVLLQLRRRQTSESNDILTSFFRELGRKIMDGQLRERSSLTKYDTLYECIITEDIDGWFVNCAQNRALNKALNTNAYQPEWVMGSEADDLKLVRSLVGLKNKAAKWTGSKETSDSDVKKALFRYRFDFEQPTSLDKKLQDAVRGNVKLRPLVRATLAPPYQGCKQHIRRATVLTDGKDVVSIVKEMAREVDDQIENYAPHDERLSDDVRKSYVKLAVGMYLCNNKGFVTKEKLLQQRDTFRESLARNAFMSAMTDKVGGGFFAEVSSLYPGPGDEYERGKSFAGRIFDAVKKFVENAPIQVKENGDLAGDFVKDLINGLPDVIRGVKPADGLRDGDERKVGELIAWMQERLNTAAKELTDAVKEKIEKTYPACEEIYTALNEIAAEESGGKNDANVVDNGGDVDLNKAGDVQEQNRSANVQHYPSKANLTDDGILMQSPHNCCWLLSTVNALKRNDEGRAYLETLLKGNTFTFRDYDGRPTERDITVPSTDENCTSFESRAMTQVEEMKKSQGKYWKRSTFCDMDTASAVLGLVPVPVAQPKDGEEDFVDHFGREIEVHLNNGEYVTFNTGNHFIAITGIRKVQDKWTLTYADSLTGKTVSLGLSDAFGRVEAHYGNLAPLEIVEKKKSSIYCMKLPPADLQVKVDQAAGTLEQVGVEAVKEELNKILLREKTCLEDEKHNFAVAVDGGLDLDAYLNMQGKTRDAFLGNLRTTYNQIAGLERMVGEFEKLFGKFKQNFKEVLPLYEGRELIMAAPVDESDFSKAENVAKMFAGWVASKRADVAQAGDAMTSEGRIRQDFPGLIGESGLGKDVGAENDHEDDDFSLLPKQNRSVEKQNRSVKKDGTVSSTYRSQDEKHLKGESVTDEWEILNEPEVLKTNRKMLDTKCPRATAEQRSLLLDIGLSNAPGKKLADCLKTFKFQTSDLRLANVEPVGGSRDLACILSISGQSRSARVLVGPDGSVTYDELYDICEQVSATGLFHSLMRTERPAVEHFGKLIFAAIDKFDEAAQSGKAPPWGFLNNLYMKGVTLNLLVSVLPSVVKGSPGKAPEDLYADVWKGLRLPGEAPRSNDPQAGRKFLDAIRNRVVGDIIACTGAQGRQEEYLRKMLLPNTDEDYASGMEKFDEGFRQTVSGLMQPVGLPFSDRIKLLTDHEGQFSPKLENFLVKTMDPEPYSEESLSGVFRGDGRQTGTKYYLNGKCFCTISETSSDAAVQKLKAANYSPRQIYQLGRYLNNYGMNLMGAMGLFCNETDCKISILSEDQPKADGDMLVRAEMPVIRWKKFEDADGKYGTIADRTNQFIVHDFVIHNDGTMEMRDLYVSKPESLEHIEIGVSEMNGEKSQYEADVGELRKILHVTTSFDIEGIVRSFNPDAVTQLKFLGALLNPYAFADHVKMVEAVFLQGWLLNALPQAMEKVRAAGGLGNDQQKNFSTMWTHLGLEGDAPLITDKELKLKFFDAVRNRVNADLREFPEAGLTDVGSVSGIPHHILLRCLGDPAFVPNLDDFYFKPSGACVSESSLQHRDIDGVECLDKIDVALVKFQKDRGGSVRYSNAVFLLDGVELDVGQNGCAKHAQYAHDFENAFTKKGFTLQQTYMAATYLNECFFSMSKALNVSTHKGVRISASRVGNTRDMRLELEVPTRDQSGTLVNVIIVHEDGSFVTESIGRKDTKNAE